MDLGIRYGRHPRWFHGLGPDEQADVLAWASVRGEVQIGKPQTRRTRGGGSSVIGKGKGTPEAKAFWRSVVS